MALIDILLLIRPNHPDEHCPMCNHGMSGIFRGMGKLNCPECNHEVSRTASQKHVSRWVFSLLAILMLFVVPMLTMLSGWYLYSVRDERFLSSNRAFFFTIIGSVIYLVVATYKAWKFKAKYREHLTGSFRLPHGSLISLAFHGSWIASVITLVASFIVWSRFDPSMIF